MTFDEFVHARLPALLRYAAVLAGDRELAQDTAAVAVALIASAALTLPSVRPEHAPAARPAPSWAQHMRFTWLPAALSTDGSFSAGEHGEVASFGVQDTGLYLSADFSPPDRPAPDLPGWTATTVNGLPARYVSRDTRTLVTWTLPSGRHASLEYGNGASPTEGPKQPTIEQDALHIAAALRDDGDRLLRSLVTPTFLPPELNHTDDDRLNQPRARLTTFVGEVNELCARLVGSGGRCVPLDHDRGRSAALPAIGRSTIMQVGAARPTGRARGVTVPAPNFVGEFLARGDWLVGDVAVDVETRALVR